MADEEDNDALTVAAVGGGALLAYLLLRGRWGLGFGGGNPGGSSPSSPGSTAAPVGTPCRVRVDSRGISVNGVLSDASAIGPACRGAVHAEITITGGAITGPAQEAVRELKRAHVPVVRKGGMTFDDLWEKTAP